MIDLAFAEDKAIVEEQQRLIDLDPANAHLASFPFDKSGQSARRILRRLLDEEQAQARHAAE
jgi:hypothetical protein